MYVRMLAARGSARAQTFTVDALVYMQESKQQQPIYTNRTLFSSWCEVRVKRETWCSRQMPDAPVQRARDVSDS